MEGLFIVVFGLGALGLAYLQRHRTTVTWQAVADELGCTFTAPSWLGHDRGELRGQFGDISIVVSGGRERTTGNSSSSFTVYRAGFAPVGPPVHLSKQRNLPGFLRRVQTEDVSVGDETFDDRVHIVTTSPESLVAYLSPARRNVILHLIDRYDGVRISERNIEHRAAGLQLDRTALRQHILHLVDAATVLAQPTSLDVALGHQGAGDLQSAVEAFAAVPPSPTGHPNQIVEQLQAEAHDVATAPAPPVMPARPAPPAMPERAMPTPAQELAPESAVWDQAAIIDDLFHTDRPAYEAQDHFEATHLGLDVRWTGTVKRVREFHYDMVFSGSGLRAVVTVGRSGAGAIGSDIDAIVQLDAHALVEEGTTITFEGQLVRLDRYLHNVFVAEARIV